MVWRGKGLAADERGLETLEFIGLFPLVLLTVAIALQFLLAGYTGVVAASAAREGARAAAVNEDGCGRVYSQIGGWAGGTPHCVPIGGDDEVGVEVTLPVILVFPDALGPYSLVNLRAALGHPVIPAKALMRKERRY